MELMDRRGFLRSVVGGVVVVTVATTAGVTLLSEAAEAAPVPADKNLRKAMEDFAEPETVQYRYGPHRRHYRRYRRHHRRWYRRARRHCWWHRGVRRCRW